MKSPPCRVSDRLDWDAFVARDWDQGPVLFKTGAAQPFVAADVFRAAAVAAAHARRRAPGTPSNAQVTIDGMQQRSGDTWMPRRADLDLDGYRRRMASVLGTRRYALIVNGFHAFDRALWTRERAFFAPLWARIGLPLTGAITTLFHGNYERTPVGVHKDRFSTFLYAIEGRKRMRFWPARPWTEPVSTVLDYQRHVPGSFAVDVGPGDLLYWPSTYYHVGESVDGSVATSVNIGVPRSGHRGVYDFEDLLADMDDAAGLMDVDYRLRRLFPTRPLPATAPAARENGELSPRLPAAMDHALGLYRQLGSPTRVKARVRAVSLRRLSAGGFEPVPVPSRRAPLRAADRVSATSPLLWNGGHGGPLLCAANGHCHAIAASDSAVIALLRSLDGGQSLRVGDLLRPFGGGRDGGNGPIPANRAGMRRLLNLLHATAAIARDRRR